MGRIITSLIDRICTIPKPLDEWTEENMEACNTFRRANPNADWLDFPKLTGKIVSVYFADNIPWYTIELQDGRLVNRNDKQITLLKNVKKLNE
jgi:hypothetical protein